MKNNQIILIYSEKKSAYLNRIFSLFKNFSVHNFLLFKTCQIIQQLLKDPFKLNLNQRSYCEFNSVTIKNILTINLNTNTNPKQ